MAEMNLISMTVDEFCEEIKINIEYGLYKKPFLGIGKTGIGKTESIKAVADELGIGFKEIRLINHTETDMMGIPLLIDALTGKMVDSNSSYESVATSFAKNELLPIAERDGEKGILVLDEITSAPINMRTIAYQLLDSSRGVGNYKLPEKWLVVCLGNGMNDGGNFQGIEPTIFTRCLSCYIECDLSVWKKWAAEHNTHPSVMAFVTFDPSMIHTLKPDAETGVVCCPRAWTALSEIMHTREDYIRQKTKDPRALVEDRALSKYAGLCIGEEATRKFMAFYRYNKETINPEDILSGNKKAIALTSQLATEVIHLTIESTCAQLNKEVQPLIDSLIQHDFVDRPENQKYLTRLGNALRWVVTELAKVQVDFATMFIKELCNQVRIGGDIIADDLFAEKFCPELTDFFIENENVFGRN